MKYKKPLILMLFLFAFILSACNTKDSSDTVTENEEITLTYEELKEYDGTGGNPAYVAVDGLIYDVSDSSFWKEGSHNGFQAGRDLTEEIKNVSPHGVKNLKRVPQVGRIVEE